MSGIAAASAPSVVDRAAKRRRVLDVLDRRGADSIVLRSHTAVAWYLDGVRTHVSLAGDPVAAVVVRRDGDELLVFDNEADRLADEELGPSTRPRRDARALARRARAGRHRRPRRGRCRGRPACGPRQPAARRARPLPLAVPRGGRGAHGCRDGRASRRRRARRGRPPRRRPGRAGDRPAGDARRRTLDGSHTDIRCPPPPRSAIARCSWCAAGGTASSRTRRAGCVGGRPRPTRMRSAASSTSRRRSSPARWVGATVGEAFAAGIAAYGRAGFDRDEWRRHHQGGAAGYAGRDPRGTSRGHRSSCRSTRRSRGIPTAPGAKVEDTVLVRADGIEVLTVDPRWPTIRVAGRDRPIELDRVRLG